MRSAMLAITLVGGMVCMGREVGLPERVSTWVRDVGSAVDDRAVQPIRRLVDDTRDRLARDSPKQHVTTFVKRVEALLDRLLPNKSFVQDLMGITVAEEPRAIAQHVDTVVGKTQHYRRRGEPEQHSKTASADSSRQQQFPPNIPQAYMVYLNKPAGLAAPLKYTSNAGLLHPHPNSLTHHFFSKEE